MSRDSRLGEIVVVFFAALCTVLIIYLFAWLQTGFRDVSADLESETEEVLASLAAISNTFNPESIDGQKCKAFVAVQAYEIRKDAVRNAHRNYTLYSNLAHTNALFVAVLVLIIAGLVFSIYQMATAYISPMSSSDTIEIEAANIKVKTGYVSIAVSAISMIALSLYLPNAHEVRELSGELAVLEFTLAELIDVCRTAQLPQS